MSKTLAKIARGILAAALVASVGTAMGGAFTQTEVANLSRSDAIKLSRPLNDTGDAAIRDMPVVGGRYH